MSKNTTLNLTEGPILKTLARLALPIMASSFLGTAYNITDMAWIGTLGSSAVAGVGAGGMYVWLSQGLVTLARMGGQVNAAQCIGKKRTNDARKYTAAALQLTIILGILYGIVCLFFTEGLIGFFHLNNMQSQASAIIYTRITCGLILLPYLNLTLTGLFTAQGDSKTPFKANLIGLILNMLLDPALILGIGPFPHMGVSGAAIATVTAQLIVFLVLLRGVFQGNPQESILRGIHLFSKTPVSYYRTICKIGIPAAVQGLIYTSISMVLTRMVAAFGSGAVATQRVGGQIESLSWNTADGFAAALNAFTAQNLGAGKHQRIRRGYSLSLRILLIWGVLVTAAFIGFPGPIAHIFFHEKEVVRIAEEYLFIIGIGEAFMSVELMTVGALSGLGLTKLCSILTILLTAARIPLAVLFTHAGMGLSGIWWALTLSSIVKGIVYYFTFRHVSRRLGFQKRIVSESTGQKR